MTTDFYISEVVNPYILANPGIITNLKTPGILDVDTGFEHHPLPNFGTEPSENGTLGTHGKKP
jgi:hypothetical protein